MMLAFVTALLRYRLYATLFALFSACLVYSGLPILNTVAMCVALVLISLVSLIQGKKEGLLIALWSLLPTFLLLFAGYGDNPFVLGWFAIQAFTWVLSLSLVRYQTWNFVIFTATLLGILSISALYCWQGDLTLFWQARLEYLFERVFSPVLEEQLSLEEAKIITDRFSANLPDIARKMSGFLVFSGTFFILSMIALARTLQAKLKGGDAEIENSFYLLRLDKLYIGLFGLILVIALYDSVFAFNLLQVLALPFILVSLSLIHCYAKEKGKSSRVLLIFYGVSSVVSFLLPYVFTALMVVLAIVDRYRNFRQTFTITQKFL